jgi:hypothetical protein
MYVGDTVAAVPKKTEGRVDFSSSDTILFSFKNEKLSIPYKEITSLEYGQKAGRRVGVALAVSPVAVFSKKRRHYITIAFTDTNGNKHGAVLEVAKGLVGTFVRTIEQRSGRAVDFESADAKKHFEKETR